MYENYLFFKTNKNAEKHNSFDDFSASIKWW